MLNFHVMVVMLLEFETQVTEFANDITMTGARSTRTIYIIMVLSSQAILLRAESYISTIVSINDMIFIICKSIKCRNKLFWVRSPFFYKARFMLALPGTSAVEIVGAKRQPHGTLSGCGHFCQEDRPVELAQGIIEMAKAAGVLN